MLRPERNGSDRRRVLFLQATEPAAYPPLINASMLMAEAGWDVTFLSAPIAGEKLKLADHPRIAVRSIPPRPSHVMGKTAYAGYLAAAARLVLQLRPDVVYASDPLGAAPGLLAARIARGRLVYHEHDSPAPGSLAPVISRARVRAARSADLIVFPNEARAHIARAELGFTADRLHIVWNMPRRAELPPIEARPELPLTLYYHGSITPDRLPLAIVEALGRFRGRVRLRFAGYEAPSAAGYVHQLVRLGHIGCGNSLVGYVGQVQEHVDLVARAAQASVGLAVVPHHCDDLNMRHMTGASNKPFDYMAAGLALLVSNRPDWHEMFAAPGYARACNPTDPASVATALDWFLDHPEERRAIGAQGRAKIEAEWNYDTAFAPVMRALNA